jgi:hypothetical protein
MRSYIFTARERNLLRKWLTEEERAETLDMILHRVRHFKDLEKDVELYLAVKERFKQSSSSPKCLSAKGQAQTL